MKKYFFKLILCLSMGMFLFSQDDGANWGDEIICEDIYNEIECYNLGCEWITVVNPNGVFETCSDPDSSDGGDWNDGGGDFDFCSQFDMEFCEEFPFCEWTDSGCVMSSFGDDGGDWNDDGGDQGCEDLTQDECLSSDECQWMSNDPTGNFGFCIEVAGDDGGDWNDDGGSNDNFCAQFDMEFCEEFPFCEWTDSGCEMSSFGDDGGGEQGCEGLSEDECEYFDFCEWLTNPATNMGQCVDVGSGGDGGTGGGEEDGAPECLMDCLGIQLINPDEDPDGACDWFISNFGPNNFFNDCAADCDPETMMGINQIVSACFYCLNSNDVDCTDVFDDSQGDDGGWDQECSDLNQFECEYSEGCVWEYNAVGGYCVEDSDSGDDDGPPECLYDCPGIDEVDPDENADEACDWIISNFGPNNLNECAEDCDQETMMSINQLVGFCFECLDNNNIDCSDGFDDFDEGDCDPNLMCAEVETCFEDLLYPTSCGPENCDDPIGECPNGDDGGGDQIVFISIGESTATPGSEVEVPLFFESSDPIAGIQFTIADYAVTGFNNPYLLSGIELVSNTCFESNFNEVDGKLIGILFSLDGCQLDPQDSLDEFAHIIYQTSDEAQFGSVVELVFENIIVAGSQGQSLPVITEDGQVSFSQLGDVTSDGMINVLDVVTLINFVLLIDEPNNYQFMAGDMNIDGQLDILDIVLLVNRILEQ